MAYFTTEVTASDIPSDNPIHQRLFFGYFTAPNYVGGKLLEIGCGVGRGTEILMDTAESYTAVDKNKDLLGELSLKYKDAKFIYSNVPPFDGIEDNSFDSIVSFHVIEHIPDHKKFIEEIHRVLKPGGTALISTPNKNMRIARNPWHIREYTWQELQSLVSGVFKDVQMKGISAGPKALEYFNINKKAVNKIMRWDILNLQYLLPSWLLAKPYEYLNRRNRDKLLDDNERLALDITQEDYLLTDDLEGCLDLFYVLKK